MVSFPNLAYDVGLLACEDDKIASLAPAGSDPHEYQLTPEDVELLRRADLIISTGHVPFEARIKELEKEGEISGVLVELLHVPGVKLLVNPATGQPNCHMPIYDPENYKAFLAYLANLLAELRPSKAEAYRQKASEIIERINAIVRETPMLNLSAAADMPAAQYAVSWLGVRLCFLVVKEHGTPATPGDLLRLEEALADGSVSLVVICEPVKSSASRQLEALAEEHGVPILRVPSPLAPSSILDKLAEISLRAKDLASHDVTAGNGRPNVLDVLLAWASSLLVVLSLFTVVAVYGRR